MDIKEFKLHIENNSLPNNSYIFLCKDNADFIFHQYLNEYADKNKLTIEQINSLTNSLSFNLFDTPVHNLNVYTIDKLEHYTVQNNTWIKVTKSISKEIKDQFADIIVDLGKLESWQIKDYVYSICEGVPNRELDNLLDIYKDNVYRLDNEMAKILLFTNKDNICSSIKNQLYTDTSEYNIFDLTNAILKKDIKSLTNILLQLDNIDIDAFGFLKILTDNFRKVLDIQTGKYKSAEQLGMSSKQFWAISKYNCGHYSNKALYKIYKYLTNTDFLIKSGYISTKDIISYTIIKIVTMEE